MDHQNPKICLLIPYYGSWPVFATIFVESIRDSRLIDVVFITDLPPIPHAGENVRYVNMTMEELRQRAEEKLGIPVSVDTPYKLNDLKMTYGVICDDIMQGYSHWACGDIDVVHGRDLDHFVPDWFIYDVLTFRDDWITASLTIVKNAPHTNQLFKKSISYPAVLSNDMYLGFDECFKLFHAIEGCGPDAIMDVDRNQSFTWLVRNEEQNGGLKVFRKVLVNELLPWNDFISYQNGALIQKNGDEVLYYHMIKEKNTPIFSLPDWEHVPAAYWIDRYGTWKDDFGVFSSNPRSVKNAILIAVRQLTKALIFRIRLHTKRLR